MVLDEELQELGFVGLVKFGELNNRLMVLEQAVLFHLLMIVYYKTVKP